MCVIWVHLCMWEYYVCADVFVSIQCKYICGFKCVYVCVCMYVWLTRYPVQVYCAQTSLLNLTDTVNHQTSHSGKQGGDNLKRSKISILQRTKVSIMVWRRQGNTRPSRIVWENHTYSLTVCFFLGVGTLGIQGRGTLFLHFWWHVVPQSVYMNGMESGWLKQG